MGKIVVFKVNRKKKCKIHKNANQITNKKEQNSMTKKKSSLLKFFVVYLILNTNHSVFKFRKNTTTTKNNT